MPDLDRPSPVCPRCERPLPGDAPLGNCPACMLEIALNANEGGPEPTPEALGRFGDHELIEEIGRGGMGVVWRARQISLQREVAVKMILGGRVAGSDQVLRFYTEARAAARLEHPHIVPIYEIGEEEGQPFYSMKLLTGASLSELRSGPPAGGAELREAAATLAVIARAVHFAHQRGVLHRDIKPSNILLDAEGRPYVADFGLARLLESDSGLTRSDAVLGSPAFMSPEQAAGGSRETTTASDVYSLGAVLYHLLTGQPPFASDSPLATIRMVLDAPPRPPRSVNPAVPRDLEVICLQCLEKEPARRYVSAEALAEDLERWLAGSPIAARRARAPERLAAWARRRPELATLAAALILALLVGGGGVVWQWRRAESRAREVELEAYAGDVFAASEALERGQLGRASDLLSRTARPGRGSDLLGFEWRHLWRRCQGDPRTALPGHEWIVTRVAFSPDGRLLASGGMDGAIRVWNGDDGSPIGAIEAGLGGIWCIAFLPDAPVMVASGSSGKVRFWSTETWTASGADIPGQLFALTRDGSRLVAVEASPWDWSGRPGGITLWDARTRSRIATLPGHGRFPAFAPDGRTLAWVASEREVKLWDAEEGEELPAIIVPGAAWSLSFSPDGSLLAAAGWDETAEVWDWRAGKRVAELGGHDGIVWSAVFSPDGTGIVTTASDQAVRLWNVGSWRMERILRGHSSEVWCAAFRPDGGRLATGGKDTLAFLWRLPSVPEKPSIPHYTFARVVFSPDGRWLATRLHEGGPRIVWWEVEDRRRVAEIPGRYPVGFSADGRVLFAIDPVGPFFEEWTLGAETPLRRAKAAPGGDLNRPIVSGWSPSRAAVLCAETEGPICLWDARSGAMIASWPSPGAPLRDAVLSGDASWVALAPVMQLARHRYGALLRHVVTGREMRLAGHRELIEGLAFSHDGAMLATASVDATVKLWSVETGEELVTLAGHLQDVHAVAFSPDGRTLASLGAGRDVKLWHLPTRREVASFAVPGAYEYLDFSPDGARLAVNTKQGSIVFFEAR